MDGIEIDCNLLPLNRQDLTDEGVFIITIFSFGFNNGQVIAHETSNPFLKFSFCSPRKPLETGMFVISQILREN
jgi:hypothetical protein